MKTDPAPSNPSVRPVCPARTLSVPENGRERRGSPSFIFDSLGSPAPQRSGDSFRLTERDREIVNLVFRARALRRDQIEVALFPQSGTTRCQSRLTLLLAHRYLDRLPRRSVNDPAVYLLSRRSTAGNRLMRQCWGEAAFRRRMTRLGSLPHLLGENDVRVRMERACRDLGWELPLWQGPGEIARKLAVTDPIADAYFQIRRTVSGQERTAAFFLELERASKSSQVLRRKLERYGDLYYSGRYEQRFGIRALRVLVVFADGPGYGRDRRIANGLALARQLGITLARFATLDGLTTASPVGSLLSPLWAAPAASSPIALFSGEPAPATPYKQAHSAPSVIY